MHVTSRSVPCPPFFKPPSWSGRPNAGIFGDSPTELQMNSETVISLFNFTPPSFPSLIFPPCQPFRVRPGERVVAPGFFYKLAVLSPSIRNPPPAAGSKPSPLNPFNLPVSVQMCESKMLTKSIPHSSKNSLERHWGVQDQLKVESSSRFSRRFFLPPVFSCLSSSCPPGNTLPPPNSFPWQPVSPP